MPAIFSKPKTTKHTISQPVPTALPTLRELGGERLYMNIPRTPPEPPLQFSPIESQYTPKIGLGIRSEVPHGNIKPSKSRRSEFHEHVVDEDSSVYSVASWEGNSAPSSSQSSLQSLPRAARKMAVEQKSALPHNQPQNSDTMMRRGLSQRYKPSSQKYEAIPTTPVTSQPLETRTRTDTRMQGRWFYTQTTRLSPKERKQQDKLFLEKLKQDKANK